MLLYMKSFIIKTACNDLYQVTGSILTNILFL